MERRGVVADEAVCSFVGMRRQTVSILLENIYRYNRTKLNYTYSSSKYQPQINHKSTINQLFVSLHITHLGIVMDMLDQKSKKLLKEKPSKS